MVTKQKVFYIVTYKITYQANGSVYTEQLICFMFIGVSKDIPFDIGRIPISEF